MFNLILLGLIGLTLTLVYVTLGSLFNGLEGVQVSKTLVDLSISQSSVYTWLLVSIVGALCYCLILSKNYYLHTVFFFLIFTWLGFAVFQLLLTSTLSAFLFWYESILIPSVILVYSTSPNLRSKKVAWYFFIWTQLGSTALFIAALGCSRYCASLTFTELANTELPEILPALLFLGFAVKIPVWPFYFWLTKTHVEASTGFSIFLSGVLVKIAAIGVYKLNLFAYPKITPVILIVTLVTLIDLTVKVLVQSDLKKIIAYLTVQEMAVVLVCLLFKGDSWLFLYASLTHSLLSASFFLLSELFYKRFGTRNLLTLKGALNSFPSLTAFSYLLLCFFLALPFTVKFIIESAIFLKLFQTSWVLTSLILVLTNYVFLTTVAIKFISIFFGKTTTVKPDLSRSEATLLILPVLLLLVLTWC